MRKKAIAEQSTFHVDPLVAVQGIARCAQIERVAVRLWERDDRN